MGSFGGHGRRTTLGFGRKLRLVRQPSGFRNPIVSDTGGQLACLERFDRHAKRTHLTREVGDDPFEGVESISHGVNRGDERAGVCASYPAWPSRAMPGQPAGKT